MEPDENLRLGRRLTIVNLLRVFIIAAGITITATITAPAGSATNANWLRLAVIALCCLLTFRGRRWALYLLGVLTAFAALLMVVIALGRPMGHWSLRVLFGGLGAVQLLAYLILLRAPEVRAFMASQADLPLGTLSSRGHR